MQVPQDSGQQGECMFGQTLLRVAGRVCGGEGGESATCGRDLPRRPVQSIYGQELRGNKGLRIGLRLAGEAKTDPVCSWNVLRHLAVGG